MAMPGVPKELSLTKWMEPILNFFAELGGYTPGTPEHENYIVGVGGEWIASAIEAGIDWISKGLVNRGLKALAAAGFGLTGLLGKNLPPRLRKELQTMANHLATRVVYFSPRVKLATEEDRALFEALAAGDFERAVKLAFRTPEELSEFLRSLVPGGAEKSLAVTKPKEEIIEEEVPLAVEEERLEKKKPTILEEEELEEETLLPEEEKVELV